MISPEPLQLIAERLKAENVPGASVAIIEAGAVSQAEAFGHADGVEQIPATTQTVFQAASITKPIFAYYALKLAQEGVIDLDKPLSDYLPEPYVPDEPRLPQVTARRVLCHTPGFPNWRGDDALKLYFNPGERWSYSGEGFVYLQKVVEHVTGRSITVTVRENVLKPFGMIHSSLIWLDAYENQIAEGHDAEKQRARMPDGSRPCMTAPNAAYSLYATPTDIAKFMCAMFEDNSITRQMLTPQVNVTTVPSWSDAWLAAPASPVEDVLWGSGWGLQKQADEIAFWHWGDNGSFHCFALGFPARRTGIVVMTNGQRGRQIYTPLIADIYGKQPALRCLEQFYS